MQLSIKVKSFIRKQEKKTPHNDLEITRRIEVVTHTNFSLKIFWRNI